MRTLPEPPEALAAYASRAGRVSLGEGQPPRPPPCRGGRGGGVGGRGLRPAATVSTGAAATKPEPLVRAWASAQAWRQRPSRPTLAASAAGSAGETGAGSASHADEQAPATGSDGHRTLDGGAALRGQPPRRELPSGAFGLAFSSSQWRSSRDSARAERKRCSGPSPSPARRSRPAPRHARRRTRRHRRVGQVEHRPVISVSDSGR